MHISRKLYFPLLAFCAEPLELKGVFDCFKIILFQDFFLFCLKAAVQLNAFDIITADAYNVMVVVVRPDLISPFAVAELQLTDHPLSLKEIYLAIYCCLIYIDIIFFMA